ncbi:gem-associated protein 8 [Scleropages formosus]|uniref:Gem (nuclear organelle) associated protein 8 n=1 Tax=Scleropages formosus TaxID=113540 RepID=A0A8C9VAK2_SCLFO|nr:gem-associated protein 8 [Scleropages formosus]
MDDHGSSIFSWFAHPVYSRYWNHYHQAKLWQQRHRQAYRKALASIYGTPAQSRYSDWHGGKRASSPRPEGWRSRARAGPLLASVPQANGEMSSPDSEDVSSDSDIEYDVSNMEITDELRQYFAQTERHREELKQQQQMDSEHQSPYILADHDLHRDSERSAQPPAERPGERRRAEMKILYGEDASKILGMETAMQLTFDRNCDRKQPKYWPVIPLKL